MYKRPIRATYFPVPAQSVTYGYDNLDRLTSAVMPTTSHSFAYDFNGNRTSKIVGASTQTYAYPATSNKLSSITGGGTQTFTHDADGAVTGDGSNTFTYDTRGRMIGATTTSGAVTYQLNALGQRYAKPLSGATTVYLYDQSGKLIAETADAGQTYTQYVWLADTPVAVIKPTIPDPTLYFIHTDNLDTPRLIANQSQQAVWRWDNDDPFGANVPNQNPSGLGTFTFNLRFPGQYFDSETNNHYNYYRDYSPEIGRYIESDPIGLLAGINTYAYVLNNPLSFIDPLGLAVDDPGFAGSLLKKFIEKIPSEAEGTRLGGACVGEFCKQRRRPQSDDDIIAFCTSKVDARHSIFAGAIVNKCIRVCKNIVNQPGFPASCPGQSAACLVPQGGN
jgi:RHS repeat-associated protein